MRKLHGPGDSLINDYHPRVLSQDIAVINFKIGCFVLFDR